MPGAEQLHGDAADGGSIVAAIGDRHWDVVINFHVFDGSAAERQVRIFEGRTSQFIFISSAAAYGKPVRSWPITESSLLANPVLKYATSAQTSMLIACTLGAPTRMR